MSAQDEPVAKRPRTEDEAGNAPAEAEAKDVKPPGEGSEVPATGEAETKETEPAGETRKLVPPPQPIRELEEDAPASTGSTIAAVPRFHTKDTTLNVMPSTRGNLLMSLTDGGIQHLLAGARSSVGITRGRYMFEVKVIENVSTTDQYSHRAVGQRHVLRVGFATSASKLFLGDTTDSICFDGEALLHNRVRTKVCDRLGSLDGSVLAVVLNLQEGHANFNTVSLFKDGRRLSQPQALPDRLKGKALFPAVTFKNITSHVNFGPEPLAPLPFKCRMVHGAAKSDAKVVEAETPADGKYEVLVPVGLPDEGTFDWLDAFLEKNQKYTELSDRMILDWAERSGISRNRGYAPNARSCRDKPEMSFGVKDLDDDSIRRAVYSIAPIQERHYIVMEVRGNLLREEREALLARFSAATFRRVAHIVVGEPTPEYKQKVQTIVLQQKQEQSDKLFALQQLEKKRKKELDKLRAKAESDAAMSNDEPSKHSQDEPDEEMAEEPPKAELTPEEQQLNFRPSEVKDLTPAVLSASFSKFTLPEKSEGFDAVKYEWAKGAKCTEYFKDWILERKVTTRVEDIKASPWFTQQLKEWQRVLGQWRAKQTEHRTQEIKKAAERSAKQQAKAAEVAGKKGQESSGAAKAEGDGNAEVEEEANDAKAEVADADKAPEATEDAEREADEKAQVVWQDLDIFGVDDVLDIAAADGKGGPPLFRDFQPEDWALMNFAFELNLLLHSFQRDVDDPDRAGVYINHLDFYYKRYFGKELRPRDFGVATLADAVDLVGDGAIYVTPKGVVTSELPAEMESYGVFAKLVENARRYRLLRLDLGDDVALKFSAHHAPGQHGKAYKGGYRGDGGKGWQRAVVDGGWKGYGWQQQSQHQHQQQLPLHSQPRGWRPPFQAARQPWSPAVQATPRSQNLQTAQNYQQTPAPQSQWALPPPPAPRPGWSSS